MKVRNDNARHQGKGKIMATCVEMTEIRGGMDYTVEIHGGLGHMLTCLEFTIDSEAYPQPIKQYMQRLVAALVPELASSIPPDRCEEMIRVIVEGASVDKADGTLPEVADFVLGVGNTV